MEEVQIAYIMVLMAVMYFGFRSGMKRDKEKKKTLKHELLGTKHEWIQAGLTIIGMFPIFSILFFVHSLLIPVVIAIIYAVFIWEGLPKILWKN